MPTSYVRDKLAVVGEVRRGVAVERLVDENHDGANVERLPKHIDCESEKGNIILLSIPLTNIDPFKLFLLANSQITVRLERLNDVGIMSVERKRCSWVDCPRCCDL